MPTLETRPAAGLVAAGVALGAEDVVDGFRVVEVEGRAGGPMDVLTPTVEVRVGFGPTEETRALAGVPVLEGVALEAVDPSCFVGDFVGLYIKLAQFDATIAAFG